MFDKDNKFGFISNNENSNNTDIKKYIDDNTIIHPLPVYKKVESPSMIMYMVNIMDLKEYTAYGAVLDMFVMMVKIKLFVAQVIILMIQLLEYRIIILLVR